MMDELLATPPLSSTTRGFPPRRRLEPLPEEEDTDSPTTTPAPTAQKETPSPEQVSHSRQDVDCLCLAHICYTLHAVFVCLCRITDQSAQCVSCSPLHTHTHTHTNKHTHMQQPLIVVVQKWPIDCEDVVPVLWNATVCDLIHWRSICHHHKQWMVIKFIMSVLNARTLMIHSFNHLFSIPEIQQSG